MALVTVVEFGSLPIIQKGWMELESGNQMTQGLCVVYVC